MKYRTLRWTDAERELLAPSLAMVRAGSISCNRAARDLHATGVLNRTENAIEQQLKMNRREVRSTRKNQ